MSYVIDVWRGAAPVERNFISLATYVSMFPQLVAGPIVRYTSVAKNLRRRATNSRSIYYGCFFFVVGLSQKTLVADHMAGVADAAFNSWESLSITTAWLAAIAYTIQIYFDFSGYSNMAIGLGYLLGFKFPLNFNYPYTATSITDFWRRWHISLSTWFRDYLFIPLGGSRTGNLRTYANLCTVFVICGLWHGAAWTFLVWGIYHGGFLVLERIGLGNRLKALPRSISTTYALLVVIFGWVLFRSETFEQAWTIQVKMLGLGAAGATNIMEFMTNETLLVMVAAVLFSMRIPEIGLARVAALPRLRPWPRVETLNHYAIGVVMMAALFAASATKILAGSYSPFIYFRF